MTNKRLTIPKHHSSYISAIASQMGCDASEAINYLLWEMRKANFNFGQQLPQYQPQPPAQTGFDPSNYECEKATAMSGLSWQPQSPAVIQEFEQLQEEIDPVIQRLISCGLELEF
jgi:hypothetical protein